MFKYNNSQQLSVFSRELELNNYQKRRIEKTWPKFFRNHIFSNIDEEKFQVLYSDTYSRPNIPVNILIALLILKELLGQTDEEVMDSYMFDTRVQYALCSLEPEMLQGSENTLNHFRKRLNEYKVKYGKDLLEEELKRINDEIIKISGISSKLRRVDSMLISSSCKNLNRIELVYEVNKNIVRLLQKSNFNVKDFKKYANEKDKDELLYQTKSTEENNKLDNLLHDSIKIYNRIAKDSRVNETQEFKNLERLIDEQYNKETKKAKDNKEISPTSLQTPYDPDATYRSKYGNNKGYAANIEEIIPENAEDNNDAIPLINDWSLAQNVKSDKEFMKELLEKNKDKNLKFITDSAYFSKGLEDLAKETNNEIHPTELVGKKTLDNKLGSFSVDEETKEVLECPNNQKPITTNYDSNTDEITATFDVNKCKCCPFAEKCAAKGKIKKVLKTKLSTYERYSLKEKMNEEEYIKTSNRRAGIEGTISAIRRRYHVDNRGGKGEFRLKIKFNCIMVSINIKRMIKSKRYA